MSTIPIRILLASTSKVKRLAVELAMGDRLFELKTIHAPSGVSEQPVGSDEGRTGAENRLTYAMEHDPGHDLYIAMENYIEQLDVDFWMDRAIVKTQRPGQTRLGFFSRAVLFPSEHVDQIKEGQTIGHVMDPNNPTDWHVRFSPYKTRAELLAETLRALLE